jgi:hypothetical protein
MVTTSNLYMTLLEQSQSQKEVTVNEALMILDESLIARPDGEFWRKNRLAFTASALSGTTVTTSLIIPDRSIVFGVHARVTTPITGATSFSVGITGETGLFGSSIGIADDSTNIGIINPRAFFADTPVILTRAGSNFSGGVVELVLHYMTFRGGWDF